MSERRLAARTRMLSSASIDTGLLFLRCVALDVSATGVHLYLPDLVLPTQLVLWHALLHLPDGTSRLARRIWQHDKDIGFEFRHAAIC